MKVWIEVFLLLFTKIAFSAETVKLKTPRGENIEVTVHANSQSPQPTIIVAPGTSCNSKGPLFQTLGSLGANKGFTIVRFEWNYCTKNSGRANPSLGLKDEKEDFETVLNYAQTLPSVNPTKMIFAGKSMGSTVAFSAFKNSSAAKALALLTPLCSRTNDNKGHPLPGPINTGDKNYPFLKNDPRPVLMVLGENDPQCRLHSLYSFLSTSKNNINVVVAGGDHGFRITNTNGTQNDHRTQKNIDAVILSFLNWSDLKLNP